MESVYHVAAEQYFFLQQLARAVTTCCFKKNEFKENKNNELNETD